MLRARGIAFSSLPNDGKFDAPLGESTGAAAIFGASGGVLEAALRSAAHLSGISLPHTAIDFVQVRGVEKGMKVAEIDGLGKVAAVSGIARAQRLLKEGAFNDFVMVEVMACIGGCLGG